MSHLPILRGSAASCCRRGMRFAACITVVGVLLLTAACATAPEPATPAPDTPIAYPIEDGIKATVIGTPPAVRADLPEDVPIKMHALAPLVERPVPPVLEYATPLQYALAAQDEAAPLVFVVAGTGGTAAGQKCNVIMRMLYAEGLHVVCLPSPTSVQFMLGAAPHPMPGYMPADVTALHALMRAVRADLPANLQIDGYDLVGYSLGATEAAFVAFLDEQKQQFNFQRVLLLNPSVSLWTSVRQMDALLEQNLPGGVASVPSFVAALLADLRQPYAGKRPLRINQEFLYRAILAQQAEHEQMAAVIGLVFRLALANMAFAADVLTDAGRIVPSWLHLSAIDSLEPYLLASFELTFADYVEEFLLPYWNSDGRSVTRRQLLASADLRSIGDWLAANDNVAVITSADDPILNPEALAFLRDTFGERAHIFPNGGHMGNLQARLFVRQVQQFFDP